MASAVSFKVTGLDKLIKACHTFPITLAKDIDAEIEDTCEAVIAKAKSRAPKNLGALAQMTDYKKEKSGNFAIFSNARYAPFVEFGTGSKYKPIRGAESIAAKFKGYSNGGTFEQFIEELVDWVKKKGLHTKDKIKDNEYDAESGLLIIKKKKRVSKEQKEKKALSIAFAIATKIMNEGVKPQPFFFISWFEERPKLGQKIKGILKNRGFR